MDTSVDNIRMAGYMEKQPVRGSMKRVQYTCNNGYLLSWAFDFVVLIIKKNNNNNYNNILS